MEIEPGGRREVAQMAWPLSVGMLSFTIMGVTDTLLMGRVSTEAQAGVGLGAVLAMALMAFFRGVTTGPQALVAAADGAGDRARAQQAGMTAVLIGLAGGVVLTGLTWAVARFGLSALTDDAAVVAEAGPYLLIRAVGMPIALCAWGLMSGLQGLGDTRTRMWASLVGNAVNIGLDVVLIFGLGPIPAMGASGAALATVLGITAMAVVYGVAWRRRFGRPRWPSREVFNSAGRVGLPAGLQWAQGSFAFAVMTVVLAQVGAAHLAASQIVLNIVSVSFLPGYALSEASGVLVGRYLGRGQPEIAGRTMRSARVLALCMMGLCGVLFALAGPYVGGWFTRDPEVLVLVVELLLWAAAFQLFDACATVQLGALRGAGDTRFTLWVTLIGAWGCLVPVTLLAAPDSGWGWGAPGAYLGLTADLAFLALVSGVRAMGLAQGRVGRLDLLLGGQRAR